jgi:hypothetical protein
LNERRVRSSVSRGGDAPKKEIAVTKRFSLALAAAMLLGGTLAASAAGTPSSGATMAPPAKDTVSLTADQQKTAWNDLNSQAKKQTAPPSFFRAVGNVVSSSVKLQPITTKAAGDVPALAPYSFAMIEGQLLIVNPSDRKIAAVITR